MPVGWNAWNSWDDDSAWASWHGNAKSHSASSNTDWNTWNWKDDFSWNVSSNDIYWGTQEEQKQMSWEPERKKQFHLYTSNSESSIPSSQRWRSRSPRRVNNRGLFPGSPWDKPHAKSNKALSKALTSVLRYKAAELGVPMSPDGFSFLLDIYSVLHRIESWEEVVACCKHSRHSDGSLRYELKYDPCNVSNLMVRVIKPQPSNHTE